MEQSVGNSQEDNADYLSDVVLLIMLDMIDGATSMIKVTTVWTDSVLRKIAGWIKVPAEKTIVRVFKEVSEEQISQFDAINHILQGQHLRRIHWEFIYLRINRCLGAGAVWYCIFLGRLLFASYLIVPKGTKVVAFIHFITLECCIKLHL